MNILDGLLGEHAAILTLFEHLEQGVARMGLAQLQEAGALLERVLMTHAVTEDRYLFDALAPTQGGFHEVLDAMRGEHIQMAQELGLLRACESEAAARGCLARLIDVTREHFEVEERVLFSMAAKRLSGEQLEQLGEGWKRHRMKEAAP
jgi:hemerythrin-like domain-containing protein